MIKYHQYRGTIQEESEVNWDRLLLKAHQENFKDPRNDRIKEKVETGARPQRPGSLELRFIQWDAVHWVV